MYDGLTRMFAKYWLLTLGIVVSGTGVAAAQAPIVETTPAASHAFGAVRYNEAAQTHTATLDLQIANKGDADLIVSAISVVGGDTGDFLPPPATALPATIAAGNSAMFTVTFDPADAGASATTLRITSNDPVTPTQDIALTGTGATGVIGVTDVMFGTVTVTTSQTKNITISNTGTGTRGALAVTQATFLTNGGNWFKLNTPGCVGSTTTCALALSLTNGTATLPVLCNPPASATASQTATVLFTSDTDASMNDTATLTCTAGRADLTVDQTPLAFADQLVNTTSTAKTVMISNTGNETLNYAVSLAGTNPAQFIASGPGGCTTSCSLAAGTSAMVSVQFRPTTVGAKAATLRVTPANDPDTGALDVALTGSGIAPVSSPSASSLAFGSVDVGDTGSGQMLTVTNTGGYPLSISAAYLQAGATDYTVTGTTGTAVSITVQPMQTASWTIACKPSAMNSRPGTFRITSNTGGTAGTSQNVALTCNGLQGVLAFIAPPANPYDFGGVRENETASQSFTLRNTGNTPVTNITVTFTGTGTGYTVMPTTIASIAAGAQVTVDATFAPLDGTYGGTYTATYTGSWGTGKSASAALTLNGDGLTTGYDTTPSNPNALDFGDVRFDLTKTMNVSVINTAGSPLQITGLSITPGTAHTGELTVTGCLKNNLPFACPTLVSPYSSTGVNDTFVVQVTVNPDNRVAMLDGTLTISSDLPTNPNRTVPLKASSISAGITLDPTTMVLDFGPTDLDAVPVSVTRTVRLTNSGAAALDFSSVSKSGARYTFSATAAPFTLQPSASYDIQVTYTPTIEKPANQPDTGTIIFGGVAGVLNGPTSVTIELSGYGVDRHIAVGAAPTFPDTYKNPGDTAPVRPLTVTNNGDAPLDISAVMLTNDPIWTLVNPDPVVVPGRGTYDFEVKFAPVMAGKAPTGHLTIMNNDDGMPLVSIDLDGNGVARNVGLSTGEIDLGYVGIGMSARLSVVAPTEVLSIASADTMPFTIGKIEVMGGDGAFTVEPIGASLPVQLAPDGSQAFDVVFTPNAEGDFTASAIIMLDGDPQPAITLRGRGLYVDTGGGGGCSSGRGSGFAMVLVIAALVLGRRRRGAALGVVVCAITAGPARADQTRNVSLALFDPTPTASTEATFQLQGASVAEPGSLGVFALVSYANKPLVLRTAQNDDAAVENRTTLELGGAYAFGAFEVGLRMPLYLQSGAAVPTMEQRLEMFGVSPGDTARGDLTLHGKLQIGARGDLAYGIGAALTLPTASDDQFAGSDKPTGRALFLLSLVHGPLTVTANAGAVIREQAQVGSAIQRSGAVWGAGLALRVFDRVWLAGEIYGELMLAGQSGKPTTGAPMGPEELGTPIEGLLGLRYQIARTTSVSLAAGRGITSDMGSPALRGVLALAFTPSATELEPLHPPRPPEPEEDRDADGLADKADACPNEPEDKDLFDDADGCPDLDNDGDGISDTADKCPLDAEDADRFQDADGCPDKDNDGDGVPDAQDRCPLAAEDRDGVEDRDGCPDPDNDHDGLLDSVDKCPREAETINGNQDDDGCPDKGNSLVVLSPDRLELLEAVKFNGARLARSSHSLLGQVGATLRAHPEILRVRLTVHVQPTRNAAADKTLSERRAKAVREWLVEWGIDPLRLQTAGFGGEKPLVPPSTRGAAQINERLELIILERK